jgi:hypothetical protein
LFNGGVEILYDACTVEDVATFALDSVFGYVVTDPTDGIFTSIVNTESACIRLAFED